MFKVCFRKKKIKNYESAKIHLRVPLVPLGLILIFKAFFIGQLQLITQKIFTFLLGKMVFYRMYPKMDFLSTETKIINKKIFIESLGSDPYGRDSNHTHHWDEHGSYTLLK